MPGAWAGGVVQSCNGEVSVLLPQAKWDKLKALIGELLEMLSLESKCLNRKRLEQIRGFLIHVVQTYPAMKPYLIGLHMTIDGWRPNCDEEGWRLPDSMANTVLIKDDEEGGWNLMASILEAPLAVEAVLRFAADVEALSRLCEGKEPPLRSVRCLKSGTFLYGFVDASGLAFGGSVQVSDEIRYQYRQWITSVTEEESSNWRELGNLLEFIKDLVKGGEFEGFELFIVTDNSNPRLRMLSDKEPRRRDDCLSWSWS
jgi:hypothetical protein